MTITRIFLGTGTAPYTPATLRGAWDQTAGAVTRALRQNLYRGGNITSIAIAETNLAANWDVLLYRGVSDPLAAQTLTGNFDVVLGVLESNAAADFAYHIHVYVTQGDSDTPRGTLINNYVETTANEWPTTATGRALAASQAYGSLGVSAGDRLVVEIGYVALNASATSRTGTLRYGTESGSLPAGPPLLGAADTNVTFRAGSLSFSGGLIFLAQAPAGWSQANASANSGLAGGTTSITFTSLPNMSEGDTLIVGFAHKGSGFSTPPAGWTVIDQISGSGVRLEAWWKRYAWTDTTYIFTGLATIALGTIRAYKGGLESGSIVDVVASQANASGAVVGAAMTSTVPDALYILFGAVVEDVQMFGPRAGDAAAIDLQTPNLVEFTNTSVGGALAFSMGDGMLPTPGLTATPEWTTFIPSLSGSNPNLVMAMALIPQTGVATGGSHYYLTMHAPGARAWSNSYWQGDWSRAWSSPTYSGLPGGFWTFECSQRRDNGGELQDVFFTTDQPGDTILQQRWVTPRLDAQTIDGTFDLSFDAVAAMNDSASFPLSSYKVRYKVHVYISVGDTPAVRHTLLNNYVDTVDFAASTARQRLAAPQALTSGDAEAGDRIVIEWGIYSRVLPTVTPTYPPSLWGLTQLRSLGTQAGSLGNAGQGVPYFLTVGFDFSANITEQALPAPHSNETPGTATVIGAFPFSETAYDTTGGTQPGKQSWYVFTAPETARYFFFLNGSNCPSGVQLFQDPDYLNPLAPQASDGGLSWSNGDYITILDLVQGELYYIRVANATENTFLGPTGGISGFGRPGGGVARLNATIYSAPQEDDLIVPAATIYVLRDGVVVNASIIFRDFPIGGINLDFSGVALPDFNNPSWPAPTNTNPKLYASLFSFDIVEILDGLSLNVGQVEMEFIDFSVFDPNGADTGPTNFSTLDIVDGTLLQAMDGDGFFLVNGSDVFALAAFYNTVASNPYADAIRETSAYNVSGTGPWPTATPHFAASEKCAPWHIRVAPFDHDLIFYVSGGFYSPEDQINSVVTDHRAELIKVFSRAGGQQADFATVPLATGPHEGLYGIDIHPDGDVLVCNGNQVDRLDNTGTVVQSYVPSDPDKATALISVRYNHDGTKFWAFDQATGTLWQFRVSDGVELQEVELFPWAHITKQMAIWLPTGITPPSPPTDICELPVPPDSGGGVACSAALVMGADSGGGTAEP